MLVRTLRRYRLRMAALAVLLLGGIGLELANPQVVRYFIDTAQSGAPRAALLRAELTFLALALGARAVGLAADYAAADTAWTVTNTLRAELALHVLRLDMPFHKAHTPGELIERIDGDTGALANFFSQFAIRLVGNGLLVVGILVLLYREDWRVGLGLSVYAALVLAALLSVQRVAVPRWAAERQASAELYGFIEERIGGREEIRAVGAEPYAVRRLYELLRRSLLSNRAALTISHLTRVIGQALFVLGYGLGLSLGAILYLQGRATIGTAFLIVYYVGMLAGPLDAIREQVQDLQQATASLNRVAELLGRWPRLGDRPAAPVALPDGMLSVEFDAVTFRYEDEEAPPLSHSDATGGTEGGPEPALRDVSFRVGESRVLGLLGRTGSGKTTIARLLFRLYDPSGGAIRLGGIDLRDLSTGDVRRRVGLVTQDVQLFQASVRDNLTFFKPGFSDGHIEQVLGDLGLGEWLHSLPRGLDTELGTGGQGLSAGEAQLLAFARVFLQDPRVVVLDEASSRLDPATEALLERAVDRLLHGRTALIIAHRLRTVRRADDVLILEGGRVVEWGAREALAADPASRFAGLLRTGLEQALQ